MNFRKPTTGGNATARKRIQKEISDLSKENLGNMTLTPDESDIFRWHATIPGPSGSPYEGGVFHVEVRVPDDYPFSPPHLQFITKVYHCNINANGAICLDLLKNAWSPALSLYKVILSLSSLLTDPNPADPLVPQIATEYKRNRKKHDETARDWVKKYATPKIEASGTSSSIPSGKAVSTSSSITQPAATTATASNSRPRPARVAPRSDAVIDLEPIPPLAGTRRSRAENGTHHFTNGSNGSGLGRRGGSTSNMPIDISSSDDDEIIVAGSTGRAEEGGRSHGSGRGGGAARTAGSSSTESHDDDRRPSKRTRGEALGDEEIIVIDE